MSMMITSLLLRPWVMQMRGCGIKPRILADDLQLLGTGGNHLSIFEYGFNKTHQHLTDMGAKLAPSKSIVFSSNEAARIWLRQHRWRRIGRTIAVITDGRDLCAHMNAAANRFYGTTLTRRMEATAKDIDKLNCVKAPL